MKTMTTEISLTDLRFHAFHGVLSQERLVGGEFVVNVDLTCDVSPDALEKDNLEGTVNYADVLEVVKIEMRKPSKLLENVAYRVAQSILNDFPRVLSTVVKVVKVCPPWGTNGSASVTVTVQRPVQ